MKTIIKLDRISSWVLFSSMLAYFITGYGMTKGIINVVFAQKLHNSYLNYIILVTFVFHTGFATRLALIRWKLWNRGGKIAWLAFFTIFISWFIYMESFYNPNSSAKTSESENNQSGSSESTPLQASVDENIDKTVTEKTFTKDDLSKFDGQNGASAYVAVDGIVYDLTAVFKNGTHFSHIAGTELTGAFYSYHGKSAISKYPIVGKYIK